MYKLFISHASEDKVDVARPLAELLIKKGLKVWYDEFELKLGDSLRRSIDKGLSDSDFGIVILSPDFFKKNWTTYELDSLVNIEMAYSRKIILPVWHNVDSKDVIQYSPNLADKVAAKTKDSLKEVVDKIMIALDIKQGPPISIYNLNTDNNIKLNWNTFNTARKFSNIKLLSENNIPFWDLISENNESVGINLFNLPSSGKISFEYLIKEKNNLHINITFYLIPIKDKQVMVEVGFENPVDPRNPQSFFRQRIRPKLIENEWISENIDYNFSDIKDLGYVIFAPRINEGCPFPSKGQLLIKNVVINKK